MKKLSILLAEDDEMIQRITSFYLKKTGHDVDIATNGFEAVQMYRSKSYDIILMDIHMPEMDGLEAVKVIRRLELEQGIPNNRIPIIAITTNPDEEKFRNAGIDDYARKPLNLEQFQELFCSYHLA